jgi:hypothetical protein
MASQRQRAKLNGNPAHLAAAAVQNGNAAQVLPILKQINDGITRMELAAEMRRTKNGERDLTFVLGYLRKPEYDDYLHRYRRRGIARRAVNLPIKSSWDRRLMIEAATDENVAGDPLFRETLEPLMERTNLLAKWIRLDRFLAFGRYAVLLLGVAGELADDPGTTTAGPDGLLYVAPFGEKHIAIERWDEDPASPRFGLPLSYRLNIQRPATANQPGSSMGDRIVHWRRCIHVADDLMHSESVGEPRMQAIIDDLDDMAKVSGGASEMFWQGADRTLVAKIDPEAEITPEAVEDLRLQFEKMLNGLSRIVAGEGVEVSSLPSVAPDPRPAIDVLLGNISAATGIPKRLFVGSERGELASSQDQANYAQTIEDRRTEFNEPAIVRPTIDRLIDLGILPPVERYVCNWPAALVASPDQQADIALKRAQALKYAADAMIAAGGMYEDEEVREAVGLARELGAVEATSVLA